MMERAHVLSKGNVIEPKDLGISASESWLPEVCEQPSFAHDLRPLPELERDIFEQRLNHFEKDANQAAASLGLSRSAFYRKWAKLRES